MLSCKQKCFMTLRIYQICSSLGLRSGHRWGSSRRAPLDSLLITYAVDAYTRRLFSLQLELKRWKLVPIKDSGE